MKIPVWTDVLRWRRTNLWREPGLFTAWGFDNRTWTASQLAAKASGAGFGWVACQAGQHPAWTRDALHARAVRYVVWGVPGAASTWPKDADGYIVQVETDDQHEAALALLPTLGHPRAVVTNLGGCDTAAKTTELAKLAPTCLVECYLQDDPIHGDVQRMLWQARQDGWEQAFPVLGLYRNVHLGDYQGLEAPAFSVWLAEEMQPDDWEQLATLDRQ